MPHAEAAESQGLCFHDLQGVCRGSAAAPWHRDTAQVGTSLYWSLPSSGCWGSSWGHSHPSAQGNRLSCRNQEGRRGSEEAVPGHSVFPSGNPACRGTFGGRRKAVRDRLALQGGTGDFP